MLLEHQARVLLHRTRHCTVEVAQAVEVQVLPEAAPLCPADLARRVDRAVLRVEAEHDGAAAQRHADAAAQRRTFGEALPDGRGLAAAVLTAEQLVAWQHGMSTLERRERLADRDAGVERTPEQRAADLFAALPAMVLAGTAQDRGARHAAAGAAVAAGDEARGGRLVPWTFGPEQLAAQVVIDVHVPVSTVLDLAQEPGTLERYGPVSAEHIRLLRPHSWRRVLADARSGRPTALDDHRTPAAEAPEQTREQILTTLRPTVVVDADEPQHDPSARLARLVDVRDAHCCGPGCSMTSTHRDHLLPYPDGPTSASDLGRLSARCHRAKHRGWTLHRHRDGSTTWTSPLHRTCSRPSPHTPPPHVDLFADPPPPRPQPHGRLSDDQHLLRPEDLTAPPTPTSDADGEHHGQTNAATDGQTGDHPSHPERPAGGTGSRHVAAEDDDPPPF